MSDEPKTGSSAGWGTVRVWTKDDPPPPEVQKAFAAQVEHIQPESMPAPPIVGAAFDQWWGAEPRSGPQWLSEDAFSAGWRAKVNALDAARRDNQGAWDVILSRPNIGRSREDCWAQDGSLAMNVQHLAEDLADMHERVAAAIERCAKVAEQQFLDGGHMTATEIAAAIRALNTEAT